MRLPPRQEGKTGTACVHHLTAGQCSDATTIPQPIEAPQHPEGAPHVKDCRPTVVLRAHAVNGCRPVDSAMRLPTARALFSSRRNSNIASNLWEVMPHIPTMAMQLHYIR